jgi:hypothetical protein
MTHRSTRATSPLRRVRPHLSPLSTPPTPTRRRQQVSATALVRHRPRAMRTTPVRLYRGLAARCATTTFHFANLTLLRIDGDASSDSMDLKVPASFDDPLPLRPWSSRPSPLPLVAPLPMLRTTTPRWDSDSDDEGALPALPTSTAASSTSRPRSMLSFTSTTPTRAGFGTAAVLSFTSRACTPALGAGVHAASATRHPLSTREPPSLRTYESETYNFELGGPLARKWNKGGLVVAAETSLGSETLHRVVYRCVHGWRDEIASAEDESTRYAVFTARCSGPFYILFCSQILTADRRRLH